MIGRRGERGSGISVLTTRHDDDDVRIVPRDFRYHGSIKDAVFLKHGRRKEKQNGKQRDNSDKEASVSSKTNFGRNTIRRYNSIYKKDLELDNLQWLICHNTQPNQILYI